MNDLMTISDFLKTKTYPGRGIYIECLKSDILRIAYFIMGRSTNSRNRIFQEIEGGIETVCADEGKMADPHLIIYNPVLTYENFTIVTNGDQTNTIYDFAKEYSLESDCFERALRARSFEDDEPNFTPRISAIVNHKSGDYKIAILKNGGGCGNHTLRYTYDYVNPRRDVGRIITTYVDDGSPLPSFVGEPHLLASANTCLNEFAYSIWDSLDAENKISLFVREINQTSGEVKDLIINKYEKVQA